MVGFFVFLAWSEQLKTTTYFPKDLPMSFTVSVLPVPYIS